MQAPNWTDFLQCCVCTNKFDSAQVLPISLSCSHTLCIRCLGKLKTRMCPYDKTVISTDTESLPPNTALLRLLGEKTTTEIDMTMFGLSDADLALYCSSREAIDELALFLQPLAEQGITAAVSHLTKPMLKKLVTVVNCQVLEVEGRARALRAARSIADRTITELLVMHQNQQQISSLLWTAVRNRGCQFLGPVMQEEALKLILKVLESGTCLARKTIVLYVVQQLLEDFPQASKTSVGHVVQLLYRASCFNVEKREDDSSLMQLKEEFRSYESLRREHDSQIIRMAMEAGLRISPEQWSTLLYGDHKHKSDMQSIIDKLISQGAASSGLSELIVSIERSKDSYKLSEKIIPQLEVLLRVDINIDKASGMVSSWHVFSETMHALLATLQGFATFMQIQSGRYKTGMCPFLSKSLGCPKGDKCTYAHSEKERDHYRDLAKNSKVVKTRPDPFPGKTGSSSTARGSMTNARLSRHAADLGVAKVDSSLYSSVSSMGFEGYPAGFQPRTQQEAYQEGLEPLQHVYSGDGSLVTIVGQSTIPTDPALQVLPAPPPGQVYQTQGANYVVYTPSPSTGPHHHSGPLATASLPHPQQWYEKPGGVVTPDQSYYTTQGRSIGYQGNGDTRTVEDGTHQYYQRSLSSDSSGPVPPMDHYSLRAVESIRRKHETVKRSVEATHDSTSPYTTTAVVTPSTTEAPPLYYHTSQSPPDLAVSASTIESSVSYQPRSTVADEWKDRKSDHSNGYYPPTSADSRLYPPTCIASDPRPYPPSSVDPRPYTVSQEWLSHEAPHSSRYEDTLQSQLNQLDITSSSSTGYGSNGRGYTSAEPHSTSYDGSQKMTGVYSYSTVRDMTVTSGSSYPVVSTPRSTEDELRERIRHLEQQVHDKDCTIEGMKYSGPKPLTQDTASLGQKSPHHSGLVHSFSGPVLHQYSPQNTMVYVPPVQGSPASLQGSGTAYYTTSYPHQWSGPLSGPPTAHFPAPRHTPPNTGYLMHAASGPLVHQLQPTRRQEPSNDDIFLAAYLQQVEQEKASANAHHYGYNLQTTPQLGQAPRYYKYTF